MKILLTGSNGMVGRNILEHPFAGGHTFITPNSRQLDLRDFNATKNFIKSANPDLIIHAAGLVGGIQANISRPIDFMVDNLDMGRNIIMAAKENNVKNLLNIASSCMYPKNGKNPLKEDDILSGLLEPTNEGYALAKIVATKLCEYIAKSIPELNYKTIIPCNLYGRHDKFSPESSHMLPAVIRKIHEAKQNNADEVVIWGDGKARREFMYAGDLADFIGFWIDHSDLMPQNVNVGIGKDFTIEEYYKVVAKVVGYNGGFTYDLSKPAGMKQKLVDDSKIKELGWKPLTSLEEGITKTYDFFKSEYND
ncbi:MAG: GDP-L-fucose synthase [Allomuricauda sp.]